MNNMPNRVIITGSCGFIGSCLTSRLLEKGVQVVGIDNLSRKGSEVNASELLAKGLTLHRVDVADFPSLSEVFQEVSPVDAVFHLAAQVAVTRSYTNRRHDFTVNAVGSFNVIECIKRYTPMAYALYASTNKVYGHIDVSEPVGQEMAMLPYTPYGVSKAVGDMYFAEYGRKELGLTTCCLRQSCIYGHHQFGVEDQGWLAWFTIANILRKPITIYGDGRQVRDLLFVDDLVDLYLKALSERLVGCFPVGGGAANAVDLRDALQRIVAATGKDFAGVNYSSERPGDQPYFVADLSWVQTSRLEWWPRVNINVGLERMLEWMQANRSIIEATVA